MHIYKFIFNYYYIYFIHTYIQAIGLLQLIFIMFYFVENVQYLLEIVTTILVYEDALSFPN